MDTIRPKRPRGTGSLYRPKGTKNWWVKYHREGRAIRESTHTADRRAANRFLQARIAEGARGESVGTDARRIRVRDLADDMLKDYRMNDRKSLESAERRWNKHLLPFLGNMRAVSVTTDALARYAARRKNEGAGNSTINREFAALKRGFNIAYRSSPRKVPEVPTFPRLKESAPRRGFVDDVQYDKLRTHAKELWLRAMLAVAYSFGFRKGELLNLRVRQVDLLTGTIMLDPGTTKNSEGRTVKMTREVFDLLRECTRDKMLEDYVFTRQGNKPVLDFRGTWTSLCEAAGLGQFIKDDDGNQKWSGPIFHDLRRSAIRNMVRRGIPERVAMSISGHKTRAVFDRYNIVSETDLLDAARKIERGGQGQFGHSLGHSRLTEPTQQHHLPTV